MDPRRLLILACLGLTLSGCAVFRPARPDPTLAVAPPVVSLAAASDPADLAGDVGAPDAPEPGPEPQSESPADGAVPYEAVAAAPPAPSGVSGRRAIAAANLEARAASRADAFVGGVQVFAWSPGRVYEVWAAPLRVTTLTLGAGETLVSKAAGDTVRWQIGETTSGEGAAVRTHVLLKPLERGLETNLVLTTSRRVYFLDLKSGGTDGFNAAIAWDTGAVDPPDPAPLATAEVRVSDPVAMPEGPLDARYRIEPQGRRARWTPVSVFNDGRRTFIAFDPDLQIDEAPALFVLAPDGEAQMVNYRQAGGLFIVDRVFDRAELRLGDRRPQVVRIRRLLGAAR
ncbi:conjugal transfer protein TrbG [Brevundimonas sp. EAKA]|uniref:TrbG/VirB9 family P-type conjugative transfer protein n=1 Tax=Brevundimonas sp. EAKA TaxID=1495854 RepID=UPI0004A9528C|nr:TrbG/VirB9 family P-type conjugative transfer protein [Brevundimonas sp. EAKA]KDP95189.1 conjugal transfer protein TrbG [Brevundimonas sp. EAKA]